MNNQPNEQASKQKYFRLLSLVIVVCFLYFVFPDFRDSVLHAMKAQSRHTALIAHSFLQPLFTILLLL